MVVLETSNFYLTPSWNSPLSSVSSFCFACFSFCLSFRVFFLPSSNHELPPHISLPPLPVSCERAGRVDHLVRETELRQLRKASAEYEEQNSALRKHVETLQAAVSRLEAETEQQRRHSAALQHHLDSLRDVLANSFAHLPLPGDQHSSSFRMYSDLRMDQIWKY